MTVSLYGPHASGADLDTNDRAMLVRLSANAAAVYAELEICDLRQEVSDLKRQLSAVISPVAGEK
jgi:hypothetical protein